MSQSLVTGLALFALSLPLHAAERYRLQEAPGGDEVLRVNARLKADGKLHTPAREGKTTELKLSVNGTFSYREYRLPGAGRDAKALRSLRKYDAASAQIAVEGDRTSARLSDEKTLVVAHGRREGLQFYRPNGRMTRDELELLQIPGDSLPVLGLLPRTNVEVGEKWEVENWVAQMLTATEAILKSELRCTLVSVENDKAKVDVAGTVEGAVHGANAKIEITGHYLFDMKAKRLARVELQQVESRGVGAVSPGMDVTANVTLDRVVLEGDQGDLVKAAEELPLEPAARDLALALELPGGARLTLTRDWHVYQRTEAVTVLRLVKNGGLVAQCNISPLPTMEAGKHLTAEEFKADVQKTLGDKLKEITDEGALDAGKGRFVHRIAANGTGQGVDLTWHYYLVADAGGRQHVLVFAFESKLKEKFDGEGGKVLESLEYLADAIRPAGGTKPESD